MEKLMKVISVVRILAGVAGLVALGCSAACTRAQSDIAPDHFESPGTEPFAQPKTKPDNEASPIRYDAEVALPYKLQCHGKTRPPGKYSVSLRSEGKSGRAAATLHQKDQVVGMTSVVHKQPHRLRRDARIVELSGKTRRLLAVEIAELELAFDPAPLPENALVAKHRRIERLFLTKVN
jgi:hypothetical protein